VILHDHATDLQIILKLPHYSCTLTWKKIYNPNNAPLAIIGNIAASLWDIVSGFSPDSCE
jgi:hypothetical protein